MQEPSWETDGNLFLGWIFLKSGELDKALEHFDIGWNIAVEEEDYWRQRYALLNKGLAYVEMNALDDAQKISEDLKILCQQSINKTLMSLYHYLNGMIALKKNDYSHAIESLEMAVSLDPDICKNYMDSLAYAYFKSGELNKAKLKYEEISRPRGMLEYGYEFIRSHNMLGKIYEQQGNAAKAIEHYEKFLDFWKDADPDIAEVEDARKRLARLKGT
jgi:tetratricopeptide (TPR) repeat protein